MTTLLDETFTWNKNWCVPTDFSGVPTLAQKRLVIFDVSNDIITGNCDFELSNVSANTDCQGGSGMGTTEQKRQIGLPAQIVDIDLNEGYLVLSRVGLNSSNSAIKSDDIDGTATYRLLIKQR